MRPTVTTKTDVGRGSAVGLALAPFAILVVVLVVSSGPSSGTAIDFA